MLYITVGNLKIWMLCGDMDEIAGVINSILLIYRYMHCKNKKYIAILILLIYFMLRPEDFQYMDRTFMGKLIILSFIIFCIILNKYCGLIMAIYIIYLSNYLYNVEHYKPMNYHLH
jgi:hypothetical protein